MHELAGDSLEVIPPYRDGDYFLLLPEKRCKVHAAPCSSYSCFVTDSDLSLASSCASLAPPSQVYVIGLPICQHEFFVTIQQINPLFWTSYSQHTVRRSQSPQLILQSLHKARYLCISSYYNDASQQHRPETARHRAKTLHNHLWQSCLRHSNI